MFLMISDGTSPQAFKCSRKMCVHVKFGGRTLTLFSSDMRYYFSNRMTKAMCKEGTKHGIPRVGELCGSL